MDIITIYTIIYYTSLLFPILGVLFVYRYYKEQREKVFLNHFGIAFTLLMYLLIAFRPLGEQGFKDSPMYISIFLNSKYEDYIETKDVGWGIYTFILSKIVSVRMFFVLTTLLGFIFLIWISVFIAKERWFLMVLAFMVSIYFWNHQVFTLRQGLGAMIFITGIFQKKYKRIIFFLIAMSIHKTFAIPFVMFMLTNKLKSTRSSFIFFGLSFFFSFFVVYQAHFFLNLFDEGSDIRYYFDGTKFRYRWDIVAYTIIFFITGKYFVYKFNYRNELYNRIYHAYIMISGAVLCIHPIVDGFVHRFIYMSWFLIPLIVFLPIMDKFGVLERKTYTTIMLIMYVFIVLYTGIKIISQNNYYVPL